NEKQNAKFHKLWLVAANLSAWRGFRFHAANGEEALAALRAKGIRRTGRQRIELLSDRRADRRDGGAGFAVRTAHRLGNDGVDDLELEQVLRGDLERLRNFFDALGLRRVAILLLVQNGCSAFG